MALDRDRIIINGKKVEVTDEQYEAAVKLNLNRCIFIWPSSNKYRLVISNTPDERDHRQWAIEDLGETDYSFEFCPRGYMDESGVYIYIGSAHREIEPWRLDAMDLYADLRQLLYRYKQLYLCEDDSPILVPFYNGVIVGEVGTKWKPKKFLCALPSRSDYMPTKIMIVS